MARFSFSISPLASWGDVRNTLSNLISSLGSYLSSQPPATDMQGSRVTSVGNPTSPMDAVNLQTLQGVVGGIGTSTTFSSLLGNALNPTVALGTIGWKVSVSPWATITAPSGGLTLNAGGTNQNISLNPTGTGSVVIASSTLVIGAAPAGGCPLEIQQSGSLANAALGLNQTGAGGHNYRIESTSPNNGLGVGRWVVYDITLGSSIIITDTLGNVAIPGTLTTSTLTATTAQISGSLSALSGTVTNTLTAGAVNATGAGGFLANGVAGQTATIAYTSGAGTHTLTFSAGLLVGHI